MKVLHFGNIANNAYNNAKFLRRRGVEAHVLVYGYTHIMASPEWEDATFDAQVDEDRPDWGRVELNGFQRPGWFHFVDLNEENRNHFRGERAYFRGHHRLLLQTLQCKETLQMAAKYAGLQYDYRRLVGHRTDQLCFHDVNRYANHVRYLRRFMEGYDIVQAYGLYEPALALLTAPRRPLIAYEHGTMRDFPFEEGAEGRWISLAYKKARKVLITNADSVLSARRMGLSSFEFIPHPVDETQFSPRPTALSSVLRSRYGCEFVLFSPSRHNWLLKGNDKVLRAFAKVVQRRKLDAVLLLCHWGQELDRSRKLIEELGIAPRIVWLPPLNKRKLAEYYNAADVVLDQFTLGAFGTTTPEAMACGRPVMLHLNEEVHKWCFPEMPPVVSAFTEDEIAGRLADLLQSEDLRNAIGQRARAWVTKYHGWELVAERQMRLYREILD